MVKVTALSIALGVALSVGVAHARPSKDAGMACFESLYKRWPPSTAQYSPFELVTIQQPQYHAATIWYYSNWGLGKRQIVGTAWSKRDFQTAIRAACRRAFNRMRDIRPNIPVKSHSEE